MSLIRNIFAFVDYLTFPEPTNRDDNMTESVHQISEAGPVSTTCDIVIRVKWSANICGTWKLQPGTKFSVWTLSATHHTTTAFKLTSPCFSRAVPWQSLISWPICPHKAQGRGLLGLNSSLMMVKLGSWVARPSMIRSAARQTSVLIVWNYCRFQAAVFEGLPSAPHRQWWVLGSWWGWAVRHKCREESTARLAKFVWAEDSDIISRVKLFMCRSKIRLSTAANRKTPTFNLY